MIVVVLLVVLVVVTFGSVWGEVSSLLFFFPLAGVLLVVLDVWKRDVAEHTR
jgi:uncharacterized membrane protein